MLPEHLLLVRDAWDHLEPRAEALVAGFYARLFAADPAVKELFRYADPAEQPKKLLDMLVTIVHGLAEPARIRPVLEDLGRRHVDYGVVPAHYDTVGRALLGAIEAELGPRWTPAMAAAWTALYGDLRATMLAGAARHPATR